MLSACRSPKSSRASLCYLSSPYRSPRPSHALENISRNGIADRILFALRIRGRPHYYSTKKEEYAIIKFSLDADLSSLFNWNTKSLFVYVTADWADAAAETNSAVIWDTIITSPSSDHLANIGPAALKKLRKSAEGKSIDPSR